MKHFSLSNISIQKRLPLLFFLLLFVVLFAFSSISYLSLSKASMQAGYDRLLGRTEQLSSLLHKSTEVLLNQISGIAQSRYLVKFLSTEGKVNYVRTSEILEGMSNDADSLALLAELRTKTNKQLISTSQVKIPDSCYNDIYSKSDTSGAFATRFYVLNDTIIWASVAPVTGDNKYLGFLIKWRIVKSSPQALKFLAGMLNAESSILIANNDGTTWNNLNEIVPGPPGNSRGKNKIFEYSRGSSEILAAIYQIPQTPWMVLVEAPKKIFLQPSSSFLNSILLISIILLLAGSVLAWFMSRSITRPLNKLTNAASEIASGNYSSFVNIQQGDELGKLAAAFNLMLKQVGNSQNILESQVNERTLQLKAANTSLVDLNKRLQNLDEIKTKFFTNISHELRTPLALILGPAEKIISGTDTDSYIKKEVNIIYENARILLRQVNNLLDLSKLEAGKMKVDYSKIDFSLLLKRIGSYFESLAAERKIIFRIQTPPVLYIEADADKIERVLINFITNAFKYTPDGGEILCTVSGAEERVFFRIQDTGPGITEDVKANLFQRFKTSSSSRNWYMGGSGLGLSIVKEYIDLHNGMVNIEDAPNGGAVFTFSIPVKAPEGSIVNQPLEADESVLSRNRINSVDEIKSVLAAGKSSPAEGESLEKEKAPVILVIEDNHDMNRFISEILSEQYNVISAFNGGEGIKLALSRKPDLIISDLMMPGTPGEILITEIKKYPALQEIPIVVLTAKADDQLKIDLLNKGVKDYLSKPFIIEELKARINNLINLKVVKDYLQKELNTKNSNISSLLEELGKRKAFIETSLKEKDLLLKEIHHRVKNNLQIISSLLNLQVTSLADGKAAEILRNSQNRIRSMSVIHEKLYRSENLVQIRFAEYTDDLVRNLIRTSDSGFNIQPEFALQDMPLTIDMAIPLGLIITELVSNSIKHAFENFPGQPVISVAGNFIKENEYCIIIKDNGKGLPDNFNLQGIKTLGLQLVETLVDQVSGNLIISSPSGAEFRITFPLTKHKRNYEQELQESFQI